MLNYLMAQQILAAGEVLGNGHSPRCVVLGKFIGGPLSVSVCLLRNLYEIILVEQLFKREEVGVSTLNHGFPVLP
jgi:hypothetical protein